MKYNHLNSKDLKCFKLPQLDGGNSPKSNNKNCLLDSENLWFYEGRLQTRPGIAPQVQNAIVINRQSSYEQFDYCLHDTKVNYLGLDYQIGTVGVDTDNFMYTLYIYLIASENNVVPIGSMNFLRLSSDSFKIPENITFYTGKSQTGGGVFALVTLRNVENYNDKNYNIYEINADFNEWQRVYDYYVPTVLINGRGNQYDAAYAEDKIVLAAPKVLESQNLLNGRFHAYYTSDGYSNMFRLPVSDLSMESIVCRINYTSNFYVEWKISGHAIVDTQKFMGVDVMVEVDHEKGTLTFTSSGQPYAVPIIPTYNENNIKITASKKMTDSFSQVVDSSCSLTADGRLYLAGGQNGNVLMMCKGENPLYFPLASTADIGGSEPVTALAIQSKKIIAFKDNECYYASLKKGDRINEIGLVADNDKMFKLNDSLSPELISKSVGCNYKQTVCKVEGKLAWLGQDGEIYALDNIGFDGVKKLTNGLNFGGSFEFMDSFAVSNGRYYLLASGKKVVAADLENISAPKFYNWSFDTNFSLCGGFYRNAKLWFWCYEGNSGISYVGSLTGENDIEMYYNEDKNIELQKVKIKSYLKTINYALSGLNHHNVIETVYLALSGRGKVDIKVNDNKLAVVNLRFSTDDYDMGEYKTVTLRPHLYNIERVRFDISSDSPFAVGDIEILYRKTG